MQYNNEIVDSKGVGCTPVDRGIEVVTPLVSKKARFFGTP